MLHLNLLGDSQIKRMQVYLREHSTLHSHIQMGIVVAKSGIRISELKYLIKQQQPIFQSGSVTLVFVGTNDLKQRRTFDQMKTDLLSLVRFIRKRTPTDARLVFTTLPPFPKFADNSGIVNQIYHINQVIASLKAHNITYVQWSFPREVEHYFQQYFGNNVKRKDGLHLNERGFAFLMAAVCKEV